MGATTDPSELTAPTREDLRTVGRELGLSVEGLSDSDLVTTVLSDPGAERALVSIDRSIHVAPRALFEGMARPDGYVGSGEDWITFNSYDAYVEATAKAGAGMLHVLSIDLYLLRSDDYEPMFDEVRAWVGQQPQPVLGVLTIGSRQNEDGATTHHPMISMEAVVDGVIADFVLELVAPYADAWDTGNDVRARQPAFCGPGASPYRVSDPIELQPTNAWLLVGTESSYPSRQDLDEARMRASAGIYESMWTAPKTGRRGDLVFIYFVSPRKSAHFVGRLASDPFWRTDIEVAPDKDVNGHQWWAFLSPLVEIRPVPYKDLVEAAGGNLPLRGRSGHYLLPEIVDSLTVTAAHEKDEPFLTRILRTPEGDPRLPNPETMTMEQWTAMPSGAMRLEADVSRHVVGPLKHLVYGPDRVWTRETSTPRIDPALGPVLVAERQVRSGFIDFVCTYPVSTPAIAIEVKLSIKLPASGIWTDSPDFRQLLRYMNEIDTPGLLIDAERVLLVRRGDDRPFAEFFRSIATWTDLALIRDLILERRC